MFTESLKADYSVDSYTVPQLWVVAQVRAPAQHVQGPGSIPSTQNKTKQQQPEKDLVS